MGQKADHREGSRGGEADEVAEVRQTRHQRKCGRGCDTEVAEEEEEEDKEGGGQPIKP